MAIREEFELAASPRDIQDALLMSDVWSRYADATGAEAHDFALTTKSPPTTVFHRTMSTRPLPFLVRRLLPGSLDITESVVWRPPSADGVHTGDVSVDINTPEVTFRGELAVQPVHAGSRLIIEGPSPTTSLPIGPFRGQLDDMVTTAFRKLVGVVREQLAG